MTYRGEPILSDDDFLRRLPLVLEASQRLLLEGLVHIADSMSASYKCIYDIAAHWGARGRDELGQFERAMLFNSAWSIVDDIYAARQLLTKLIDREPNPDGFRDTTGSFAALRNKMDHLASNVGNLASAKGLRRPIFGSLSFLYIGQEDVDRSVEPPRLVRGKAYSITAGSLSGREMFAFTVPGAESLALPVDKIQLSAFDSEVMLGPPIEKFSAVIHGISAEIEAGCRVKIAAKYGCGEEADRMISNSSLYGVAVILDLEFSADKA